VIFVTVQKLRQMRPNGRAARLYQGVLLGWPREGAPLVVLLNGETERTLTTSHVRRVLHDDAGRLMYVETRNTVYRLSCAPGSEREWQRETARALAASNSFADNNASTDVSEPDSPLRRADHD
jgi:hypothetical protein